MGVLPVKLGFPKKDKHPGGTSDPTPVGGCVGQWEASLPPFPSLFDFQSSSAWAFKSYFSEHPFKTVTFLSFLPAMAFI